jgi:mRNA interferase RelE/StbE
MASYRIEFTRSAEKDLRRLDRANLFQVLAAIEVLRENPRPAGVKKLVGSDHSFRIRVGDYRVVYEIEDDVCLVLILRMAHRKDVYR